MIYDDEEEIRNICVLINKKLTGILAFNNYLLLKGMY